MRIIRAIALWGMASVSVATGQDLLFLDGFECGSACGWNGTEPASTCYSETSVLLPGFVMMPFVEIPAGTFVMGANERGSDPDEDVHQVTLTSNYLIGKTEVTQQQWEAMGYLNPSMFNLCDTCPVETVNIYEAAAYANAVSISEGLAECYTLTGCSGDPGEGMVCTSMVAPISCTGYRLPTDAQWERAARAISQTRFSHGDVLECGDVCEACPAHDQYMLYCGNNGGTTEPVGSRLPNDFGIFDMHGSVFEFVHDYYQESLGTDPVTDPIAPGTSNDRVIRGGAWVYSAAAGRSANRNEYPRTSRGADVGFRLARTIQ
jgi:formylglycine-generating enzyme required for sulfatase activity